MLLFYSSTEGALAPQLTEICREEVAATSSLDSTTTSSCDGGTTNPLPDPFLESGGQVVMESENYDDRIPRNDHDWELKPEPGSGGQTGYSGNGYLECLPNTGALVNTGYATTSPELQYRVYFETTGTYYVWTRGLGLTGSDDSIHSGIDGTTPASADRIGSFPASWTWMKQTMDSAPATLSVATTGIHTVNLWAREDGFMVDKVLLTTDSEFTPTGTGPPESPRGEPQSSSPPVIRSLTPEDGTAYYEDDIVTIAVNASDPDGDPLEYRFFLDGVLVQDWSVSQTANVTLDAFGKKTVSADVRDGEYTVGASSTIFVLKRPIGPP